MTNKKRTNNEWLVLYQQQRASGLTAEKWCAENSVNIHTMAGSITRLRKMGLITEPRSPHGSPAANKHAAPPLNVAIESPPIVWAAMETTVSAKAGCILLSCGKWRVSVESGFDCGLLTEVLRVVDSVC